MKTVSKNLMALMVIIAISFVGCRDNKKEEMQDDHGHTHGEGSDHTHDDEKVEQEDFIVDKDTMNIEDNTHTHDNGDVHHDH